MYRPGSRPGKGDSPPAHPGARKEPPGPGIAPGRAGNLGCGPRPHGKEHEQHAAVFRHAAAKMLAEAAGQFIEQVKRASQQGHPGKAPMSRAKAAKQVSQGLRYPSRHNPRNREPAQTTRNKTMPISNIPASQRNPVTTAAPSRAACPSLHKTDFPQAGTGFPPASCSKGSKLQSPPDSKTIWPFTLQKPEPIK